MSKGRHLRFSFPKNCQKIMPNLNAVILPSNANKDGKHKVRISVAHNGTTRYIPTTIILDSSKEFKKGSIVKRQDAAFLNTKLRGLLQHYQELIDELGYVDGFSCDVLINMMKATETQKHRSLSSVIDEYKKYAWIKDSNLRPSACKTDALTI